MIRPGNGLLAVALLAATVLRLAWGQDIEYKGDERYIFAETRKPLTADTVPAVGMPSGVGIANPGASVWVFLVLSRAFPAETPPALARAVQITNIAAIAALLIVTLRLIPPEEQPAWLWAIAIVSVNPIALLLHRKIWAQSLLPIFCVLLLASWLRRNRSWGAFGWGAAGAVIGQIHMSGFFYAAALFIWTLLFGRRLRNVRHTRWPVWALGTAAGVIALVPWGRVVWRSDESELSNLMVNIDSGSIWTGKFWQLWITESLGLGLHYNLGGSEFLRFLQSPVIAGRPTFFIALIHAAIVVISVVAAFTAIRSARLTSWKYLFIGDGSDTTLLLTCALWAYGALLTVSGVGIYPHYLIVTFPLIWVGLALLAAETRRALPALWLCQLILSIGILSYIHVHQGAPTGDYGVAYGSQR